MLTLLTLNTRCLPQVDIILLPLMCKNTVDCLLPISMKVEKVTK